MPASDAAADVAAFYADFGRRWAHGTSPLFEDWSAGVAADPELSARVAALPRRLQQPNLLFASARWEGCPLVPYAAWAAWVREHWDEVVATAEARSTQTNEPNRCATLLPRLARIDGPLALLEPGTAAGLCLYPDRYSVEYAAPGGGRRIDPEDGSTSFALACAVDDDRSVPTRMPEVVWRRGIDRDPIDAGDAAQVAWLETLVWPGPDHAARVTRLHGAAEVVAADPPEIVHGDILETLTDAAADAPRDATLVVFHSAVLLYLDDRQREAFAHLVLGLGERLGRRVIWLSNEARGTLAAVDAQLPAGLDPHQRLVQTLDGVPVALAGHHGAVYETAAFG